MAAEVGGHVEPGFEGVRDAFANNFEELGEVGATYAFYLDGTQVVDLWGGERTDTGAAYDGDTLQIVFSSTKGATAACAHLLAQRGLLDIDAPVVTYWPEFGQAGKEHIPVRWLLSHQAGLPTVDSTLTREEALAWEPVIHALEVQAPLWEPGVAHGYHAHHLRPPRRRGRPPHRRTEPRHVLPRGVRRAAGARLLDRSPRGARATGRADDPAELGRRGHLHRRPARCRLAGWSGRSTSTARSRRISGTAPTAATSTPPSSPPRTASRTRGRWPASTPG